MAWERSEEYVTLCPVCTATMTEAMGGCVCSKEPHGSIHPTLTAEDLTASRKTLKTMSYPLATPITSVALTKLRGACEKTLFVIEGEPGIFARVPISVAGTVARIGGRVRNFVRQRLMEAEFLRIVNAESPEGGD